MFGHNANGESSKLEQATEEVLDRMLGMDPEDEKYSTHLGHLERLTKMKTEHRHNKVSSDTVLVVLGNLFGILIIVAYEQKHILASKAMGFVGKTK